MFHIIDFNSYPATVSFALKILSALYVKLGCTYSSAQKTRFFHGSKQYEPSELGAYCFSIKTILEHKQTRVADGKSRDWHAKG